MTYTRATLAEFQAIYPEFTETTDAQYAYWATRAEKIATADFGDDQAFVAAALTAHYLALQGQGGSVDAQRAAKFGGATEVKSGSLSLKWEKGQETVSSFEKTRYGALAWPVIKALRRGPLVTGTGTYPVTPLGYADGLA
jgi:hypothetical protein